MHFQLSQNMSLDLRSPVEDGVDDDISSTEQLCDDSVESLEEFLPKIHQKSNPSFIMEEKIIQYLKQLNLLFKTDPRKKEFEYQYFLFVTLVKNKKKQYLSFQVLLRAHLLQKVSNQKLNK
ncbi:unnamed protein product [Paramecium pentaurelia]|uniref:Uncharacterized protein n=1 Tax=Paramecium pentaurelia TaxID=43138 RepID=A0A8S1T9I5_9CILI|nr:unnamed protein product [Paramecium pentaurelia]